MNTLATLGHRIAPGSGGDTERAQSFVRLALGVISATYLLVGWRLGTMQPGSDVFLVAYILGFLVVAAGLHVVITQAPGVSHVRRGFAMAIDYSSTTMMMMLGGAYTAPLFAVLLWVTVGYGMRYGSRYLAIGTGLALTCLVVLAVCSPFWSSNPYIVATVIVTSIIVPLYAHLLLRETQIAYDAATAASRAKSQFLAQASHDLRQPIHAISLFTACLRDARLGKDEEKLVENIDRSLRSVSQLFRSLLDISTLESGQINPRIQPVNLGALIRSVADQNAEAARWAGVAIRVVPSRLAVLADPNLLTVMLQNLVSNALKYSAGSDILIGCRRSGATANVMVVDRGRGIAEVDREKVFDEFYRVQRKGEDIEGVGLGLAIVKRMADLMGCAVLVRSTIGRGTSVSIAGIKVTAASPAEPAAPRAPQKALLHDTRVLVVEDSVDVLVATKRLLENWGCKVQAETTPPATIEGCDILLTDFDLGGDINGSRCIELVRKSMNRDVPAIVMTGHDETRVKAEIGDPSIPVLSKPVRPAELRAALLSARLAASAPVQ